jgi:hypothetical protein
VQEVIESWPAVCIIIPYVLIGCPIMSVWCVTGTQQSMYEYNTLSHVSLKTA